jgi:hypothetical protein
MAALLPFGHFNRQVEAEAVEVSSNERPRTVMPMTTVYRFMPTLSVPVGQAV